MSSYIGIGGTSFRKPDGTFYLDSKTRFGDLTDGLTNTLIVGERPPSNDLRFGWWYAGYGQNTDGSVDSWMGVKEYADSTQLPACRSREYSYGPGKFSGECDVYHFWSPHVGGGANFLLGDGSVRFIPYTIGDGLIPLATRAGGEVVTLP